MPSACKLFQMKNNVLAITNVGLTETFYEN